MSQDERFDASIVFCCGQWDLGRGTAQRRLRSLFYTRRTLADLFRSALLKFFPLVSYGEGAGRWGQSVLGRVHFGKCSRPMTASWYLGWNVGDLLWRTNQKRENGLVQQPDTTIFRARTGSDHYCGYLSGARCRLAYGPTDATATHSLLLKSRMVLPFWNRLTRLVPDKLVSGLWPFVV